MKRKIFYLFIPLVFQSVLVLGQQQKLVIKALVNQIKENINYFSPNDTLRLGDTIYIEINFKQIGSISFRPNEENNYTISIKKLTIVNTGQNFVLQFKDNILTSEKKIKDEISFLGSINKLTVRDTSFMTTIINFSASDTSAQSFSGTPTVLPNLDKFAGIIDFNYLFSSFNTQQSYFYSINFTAKIVSIKSTLINVLNNEEISTSPQSFSLTPNPSNTGLFHIKGEVANIQVYNTQGNSIAPNIINPSTIDLSAFPKGMYVVVATVNGEVVTKKVIRE